MVERSVADTIAVTMNLHYITAFAFARQLSSHVDEQTLETVWWVFLFLTYFHRHFN